MGHLLIKDIGEKKRITKHYGGNNILILYENIEILVTIRNCRPKEPVDGI